MDDPFERELSFLEHLEELRTRLIYAVAALFVGFIAGWFLAGYPLDWMSQPVNRAYAKPSLPENVVRFVVDEEGGMRLWDRGELSRITNDSTLAFYLAEDVTATTPTAAPVAVWGAEDRPVLQYLGPMDPFLVQIQAAFVLAVIFALPILIYQVWAFVAPGLMPGERRFAAPVIISGSLLFPVGAIFAYFLLEVTLRFAAQFGMANSITNLNARTYLSFALTMMIAFGVLFELPLALVLATRVGIVTVDWLAERRKYILIVLLVAAAVITPGGDPLTLVLLTAPLYILFEIALVVSAALDRMVSRELAEEQEEDGAPPGESP